MNVKKLLLFSNFLLTGILFLSVSAYADVKVHDYVQPFVNGYDHLHTKNVAAYKRYILNFETVKEPKVASMFYDGHPVPKDPRIYADLEKYARHLPLLVAGYNKKVPEVKGIIAEVEKRIQEKFGKKIDVNVYLATSISETDAVTTGMSTRKYADVALNMRQLVNYTNDDLRIVVAHEFFHVLQHEIKNDGDGREIIAENLYSEGWATYGSSLIYPGFADWKYISYFDKDDRQFLKFESNRKVIIKNLLKDWNTHNERKYDKYFSADASASVPFEPRSGYYIGYLAAKTLAETNSPRNVALIKYSDFLKQIKPLLKKMSEVG